MNTCFVIFLSCLLCSTWSQYELRRCISNKLKVNDSGACDFISFVNLLVPNTRLENIKAPSCIRCSTVTSHLSNLL